MRKLIVIAALCGLAGGGAYLGLGPYRAWRHANQMKMARGFASSGDLKNALLSLQQALITGPEDVEACRMMAELSELSDAPVALSWRQRVVQLKPDSVPDLLALGRSLVGAGQAELAAKVFRGIPTNASSDIVYHRLGSAVALANGDLAAAEAHAAEIVRREPANLMAQVSLQSVRLMKADKKAAGEARAALESLMESAVVHREALRQLAADAVRGGNTNRALDLTAKLVGMANVSKPDRMLRLEALNLAGSPQLESLLGSLQQEASRTAGECYELSNWMVRNGAAGRVVTWIEALPLAVRTNQQLSVILADALAATTNWPRLLEFTDERKWGDVDFLRSLQRTRAFRGLGNLASARAEWAKALQGAEGRLERLSALYRNTAAWHWSDEPGEVLWEITKRFPTQRWARQILQARLVSQGQTRSLLALLSSASRAEPADLDLKNDLTHVALLLDAKEHRPYETARELHRAEATNPYYASTFALALHLEGKSEEARGVLGGVPKAVLEEPGIAACYGMILSALGDSRQAGKYLELGREAVLLPEEKNLVEAARQQLAR